MNMRKITILSIVLIIFMACGESPESEITSEKQSETTESKKVALVEEAVTEPFTVMALSGLNLREKPNGDKLVTIPYRAEVERVGTQTYGAMKVQEIKGYDVKGDWVKVRYKGKEGYVFSGFLTKLKMPEQVKEYDYEKYSSSFDYHFSKMYKNNGERTNVKRDRECEDETSIYCMTSYNQQFNDGKIDFEYESAGYGTSYNLTINDMTLTEAYFFVRAMDLNGVNNTPHYNQAEFIQYHKSGNEISIEADGAGCYTNIKSNGKDAIIEVGCGC